MEYPYEFKKQLETKDNLIKLKDEQVKTLENSLKLKDDQIKTLENSLKIKDEKAKTLEKTIELKEEQIKKITSSAIEPAALKEKDEKVKRLQKELDILNGELAKADEELERLKLENEKLLNNQESPNKSMIIDFTNIEITKKEILNKMREILENSISNVMIVVPSIDDLQELYLYEVRSSVNMKIACSINPANDEHAELMDEFEALDNIQIRNYERGDRFVLSRDGEELFLAGRGTSDNNHLVLYTKDSDHLKLLNSLVTESWIASRKV